jgi:hypothetical protein
MSLLLALTTQITDGAEIPPLTPVDCENLIAVFHQRGIRWDNVLESEAAIYGSFTEPSVINLLMISWRGPELHFKSEVQEIINKFTPDKKDISNDNNESDNDKYLKLQI